MLNIKELAVVAKSLAAVVKEHVGKAVADIRVEFADLRKQLQAEQKQALAEAVAALPVTEPVDVEALRAELLAAIPAPLAGADGKDAEPVDLAAVAALVTVPDAIPGPAGKDADPVDVEALRAELLAAIPAPEAVAALVPVPDAIPGPAGKDADPVDLEAVAALVAVPQVDPELIRRMVAEAVAAIQLPEPADGRDALALDILPAIDSDKSYPRGTFASHDGGLWRAHANTIGMRGWECIVDGVKAIAVEQHPTDPRQVTVTVSKASGAVSAEQLTVPSMIYRGVFAPGQFAPGDTVTWGGSLWHCDEATADKPGEVGSKGWTLAAKRGRDGRDGTNGRDLTKGVTL